MRRGADFRADFFGAAFFRFGAAFFREAPARFAVFFAAFFPRPFADFFVLFDFFLVAMRVPGERLNFQKPCNAYT